MTPDTRTSENLSAQKLKAGFARVADETVESAGSRAAMALWMFFNRPLSSGGRWAQAADFADASEFLRFLRRRPARLVEMCDEIVQLQGVTEFERKAMLAAIEAYGSLVSDSADPSKPSRQLVCRADVRKQIRLAEPRRVNVRMENVQYRATLGNVSNGGAMVAGLWGLSAGHRLSTELRPREWFEGTVRWALDDRCGIELDCCPNHYSRP